MATSKQYAWYLEGNQIAIVEKDVSFDNDLDSKDYGPGASRQRWESPQSSVADALEVKYVYAPNYRINQVATTVACDRYTNSNGLLKIVDAGNGLPTSGVTYIVIKESEKWNGLQKVNTLNAGYTILETKYNGGSVTEAFTVYTDVSALEDESFELDLHLYLQKALVYYVKAKLAEDAGELKLREYAMREFKKMIEKHENSRISGLRITSAGSHAIR